jgi:hypothetical protein
MTRMTPGEVPVTVTDTLTVVSPTTLTPELGSVKHNVTVYAPDGGVLVAQVESKIVVEVDVKVAVLLEVGVLASVAVGVAVAASVAVGVAVAASVAVGVAVAASVAVGVAVAASVAVGVLVGFGVFFPCEYTGVAGSTNARTKIKIINGANRLKPIVSSLLSLSNNIFSDRVPYGWFQDLIISDTI